MIESAYDRQSLVRGEAGEPIMVDGFPTFGIFTDAYQPVILGEHFLESSQPQVMLRTEDLPSGFSESSVIGLRDTEYAIAETEPDGTGMTTIRLRKRA